MALNYAIREFISPKLSTLSLAGTVFSIGIIIEYSYKKSLV